MVLIDGWQQSGSSKETVAVSEPMGFTDKTTPDAVSGVHVGRRHLCSFHETDEQRHTQLRAFMAEGLKHKEKLIYIRDQLTSKTTITGSDLVDSDAQACLAPDQLRIFTAHQTFLQQGRFEPKRMIAWVQNEIRSAEAGGYGGLRIAADMSWVLLGIEGSERLIDYEVELDRCLRGDACRFLCLYNTRRFPPAVLQHVLTAHSSVVVGVSAYHNSYYQTAPDSFGVGPASSTLGRWIDDLIKRNAAFFL